MAQIKTVGSKIECATDDGRLIAVYYPDSVGAKGRIGTLVDESDDVFDLMRNGFPCFVSNGKYYKAIESPSDFPELMSRFMWYKTNRASYYSG